MFSKIRNNMGMVHPKKGTIIWAVGARSNTYTHYKAAEREHIELPHTIMFGKILNNMAPQNNNMPNKDSIYIVFVGHTLLYIIIRRWQITKHWKMRWHT